MRMREPPCAGKSCSLRMREPHLQAQAGASDECFYVAHTRASCAGGNPPRRLPAQGAYYLRRWEPPCAGKSFLEHATVIAHAKASLRRREPHLQTQAGASNARRAQLAQAGASLRHYHHPHAQAGAALCNWERDTEVWNITKRPHETHWFGFFKHQYPNSTHTAYTK